MNRNDNKILYRNNLKQYRKVLLNRKTNSINHYGTPILRHPTANQIYNLDLYDHVWTLGDRYYKLAHKYYGDSEKWWVIAWFNQKPTEADLEIGDVIQIPFPFDKLTYYMGL